MFFDLANAQGIKTASTCLVVIPPPMISTITLVIIAALEVDRLTNVLSLYQWKTCDSLLVE